MKDRRLVSTIGVFVLFSLAIAVLLLVGSCDQNDSDNAADDDDDDDTFDGGSGDDDNLGGGDDDYMDDDDGGGGWYDDDDCADDDDFSDDDDTTAGDDDSSGSDDDDNDDDNSSGGDDDDDDDDDTTPPSLECPEPGPPLALFLSADDSNSQASPIIARSIIEHNNLVPAGKVRTYEFTNYYQIDYPAPSENAIKIRAQLRPRSQAEFPEEHVLQIGAQSRSQSRDEGRPLNIVFSVDTSGSMSGQPIELLRDVCRAVIRKLRPGDVVSIVEWDNDINVVLDSYAVTRWNDPYLLGIIDDLQADGSTNLHGGLVRAYDLARENYLPDGLNRVILISDGQANVGVTSIDLIAAEADDSEGEGVYMVGVGVGEAYSYYNDSLMDQVTDAGKGAYIFIDQSLEAYKQFDERFMENMELAAMDVRAELVMPWYMVMTDFFGEEVSSNPDEVEPQHLGPNDAMVYHQHIAPCDPDLWDAADEITVKAHYIHPITRETKVVSHTATLAELLAAPANALRKGDAVVAYAEALKFIWENRYDESMALAECQRVRELVFAAATDLADGELFEIVSLLDQVEEILD